MINDKPGRLDIIDRKEEWEMLERRNVRNQISTNSLSFNCHTFTKLIIMAVNNFSPELVLLSLSSI